MVMTDKRVIVSRFFFLLRFIVSLAGGSGPWRLVKPGGVFSVLCGLRCGARKCLEVPLPLLQKWRRYVSVTNTLNNTSICVEWKFQKVLWLICLSFLNMICYCFYIFLSGAFLIPYVLSLALVGLPAFFMELAFGQFASLGPITIWRVCPLFKGGFTLYVHSKYGSVHVCLNRVYTYIFKYYINV